MTVLYGFCPLCGSAVYRRERRPNGNDACVGGHAYPSEMTKRPTNFNTPSLVKTSATPISPSVPHARDEHRREEEE